MSPRSLAFAVVAWLAIAFGAWTCYEALPSAPTNADIQTWSQAQVAYLDRVTANPRGAGPEPRKPADKPLDTTKAAIGALLIVAGMLLLALRTLIGLVAGAIDWRKRIETAPSP